MVESQHRIRKKIQSARSKTGNYAPKLAERVNLTQVKVHHLAPTSLAYQLSMAAYVVMAVRYGYSMQYALDNIKIDELARANVQRLSFDAMRHWGCTHFWLTRFIAKAPILWVQSLLAVALTQLRQQSEADFVLVDQTVEAAKNGEPYSKGLVNAILRRFLRERVQWEMLAKSDLEATYNYPLWWIQAVRDEYPESWEEILNTGNTHPPMILRVNARKYTADEYCTLLNDKGMPARNISAFSTQALLLESPCHTNALPAFMDGAVSVQDVGAQYASDMLDLRDGLRVLDACAAPGGKTGHILERYDVHLTALEKDSLRAQRIHENLNRLNLQADVMVCDANNVHQWWDGLPYDRILLDAPCSASGIVRRHPDIRWLRMHSDLDGLARQQAQLLRTMWKVLAVGGRLLYCTCSIFQAEGEKNIQAFLGHTPNAARIDLPITQLLPQANQAFNHDGFFYAALTKTQ